MMSDGNDESQRYFRAIEEAFIGLRGSPLLLSPEDWRQADEWRRGGVPLELVLATLEQVFARRVERGTAGKIQSLRYCASAVETAWQEVEALTAGGRRRDPPAVDVGTRLGALAASLPAAQAELAERVRGLSGPTSDVEKALATLDEEMMAEALAGVAEDERRALEQRTAAALGALGGRIEEWRSQRPEATLVHVGNGRVSDLCGALAADVVFAKDSLAEELADRGRPYEPFATLHDVIPRPPALLGA